MHDLIIFALGAAFVVVLIFAIACLESWDFRRAYRPTTRPGYLDLTVLSSSYEGRDASANSDDDELSGGGHVTPPPSVCMCIAIDPETGDEAWRPCPTSLCERADHHHHLRVIKGGS